MMMRRPLSPSTTLLHRRGISALLPLLLLAAFASSLLATLSVTRTLTSWALERKIKAVKAATTWRGAGLVDGGFSSSTVSDLLGSHLSLFDDEEEEEEEESEGEEDKDRDAPPPPPPPAGACAPMEHTDYFGTPVVEGPDFVVSSAQECCEACANYRPQKKKKKKKKGSPSEGSSSSNGAEVADPSLDCSLWVFCGDAELCGEAFGQCWLKHLAWPEASNPRTGPEVPWTSGLRSGRLSPALEEEREEEREKEEERAKKRVDGERRSPASSSSSSLSPLPSSQPRSRNPRAYHVAITASGPAVHWQSRVHYYWYLKQKRLCEEEARRANDEEAAAAAAAAAAVDETTSATETAKLKPRRRFHQCDMGGFTRVLHDPAAAPDDLSREIPTFVASPLPDGADGGYVVLNRPWAFVQWLSASRIEERFVLMAEPDHLWLRPFQNPCPPDGSPAAFPFFYIEPSKEEHLPLVARALGRWRTGSVARDEAEAIAPIGNSPTWMRTEDLTDLAPLWLETSRRMFRDAETRKAWGWVLEMYGFTVSLHKKRADAERLGEEAAVFKASAAARRGGGGGGGGGGARPGGEEEEEQQQGGGGGSLSLSLSFPPLSSEASEAALGARRAFRREQRRQRRQRRREADEADDEEETKGGKVRVLPRVMLQPPWDARVTPGAALLHYTYGCDFSLNGTFLPGERGAWRVDKREWSASPPTREELRRLKETAPEGVREGSPATLRIVEMLLEAAEAIPGWEEYARSGTATEFWDGETFL